VTLRAGPDEQTTRIVAIPESLHQEIAGTAGLTDDLVALLLSEADAR
jgi:hypothetical protein